MTSERFMKIVYATTTLYFNVSVIFYTYCSHYSGDIRYKGSPHNAAE